MFGEKVTHIQITNNALCSILHQAVQTTLIQAHEALLAPVISAFRKVDKGRTGLLSGPQFAEFCRLINPSISEEEIGALLFAVAPNAEQSVCLSFSLAATIRTNSASSSTYVGRLLDCIVLRLHGIVWHGGLLCDQAQMLWEKPQSVPPACV